MSTAVKNPVHRPGYPAFKICAACGKRFTALGLSRHWAYCSDMPAYKAKLEVARKARKDGGALCG